MAKLGSSTIYGTLNVTGNISSDVEPTLGSHLTNKIYVDTKSGDDVSAHNALTTGIHGATSANTPNRLVIRDGSGNFVAGTITANLAGTATTGTNCSRSVIAGDGLSGGGALTANRTLTVDSTVIRTTGNQTISGVKKLSNGSIGMDSSGTAMSISQSGIGYGGNDTAGTTNANNVHIQSWHGFSVGPSISGQTIAQGKPAFSVNVREGQAFISGVQSTASNALTRYDHVATIASGRVPTSRTVTAGVGLTGGGALSSNITINSVAAGTSVPAGHITNGTQTIQGSKTFSSSIVGNITGTAAKVTVSNSTSSTAYPVVWHNNSNGLFDTTGKFMFTASSGLLAVTTLATTGDVNIGTYNSTVSGKLYLNGSTANKRASIYCTTGNLHIDADSTATTYLNYYGGTGGVIFGNGAGGTSGANVTNAGRGNFTSVHSTFTGNLTGNVTGNVTGTLTGNATGNAGTATKLASISTSFTGDYPVTVNVNGVIYSHQNLHFIGSSGILISPRFQSTQATGTAPFTVASSTVVSNLNSSFLNGRSSTAFTWLSTAGTYDQILPTQGTWLRTPSSGLLPSANGTGAIGTSSWKFQSMYATTFFGALSGNATTANTISGTQPFSRVTAGTSSGTFTAGDFVATSDIRLKSDIKVIENALDKVDKLTGSTFDKIGVDKRHAGLIAQDVQAVLPEAVVAFDNDGEDYLGVSSSAVIGLLVEAIKELRQEVQDLKS